MTGPAWLVLPTFNEAENLDTVVAAARRVLGGASPDGFRVLECIPRFLPLTIKSRLPVWPMLIRTYLASPIKPMGKQMFVRAQLTGS